MTDANNHRRVALVTGAAKGMGRVIALGLLARGIAVAAVDRDAAALEALQAETRRELPGGALQTLVADLTQFDGPGLVRQVEQRFGQVDILVNNAGIGQVQIKPDYHRHPPPFFEVSVAQWNRSIAVNASAVFALSLAVVRPMMARRWGRIVNVTTSLGAMLRYGMAPYGPSKASAEALSAVMAADLAGSGVTVNVVIPGGTTNTPMVPSDAPFDRDQLIQPEVMLPPVAWLVSDEGGAVTGQRFLAIDWDQALEPAAASAKAAKPIGWPSVGVLPVAPAFVG